MENLEEQIINRIKTLLINHNMNFALDLGFKSAYVVLYYNKDPDTAVYYWVSINDMLFAPDNIFMFLHRTKRVDLRCCIGDSLEEIIIKMDLMGI